MSSDKPFSAELDDYLVGKLKTLRLLVFLMTALILFTIIYLWFLVGQIGSLDAKTVVNFTGSEIESRLPAMQREVEQLVLDAAPEVLDVVEEKLLEYPPLLRADLENWVHATSRDRLAGYQATLNEMLDKAIKEGLADLKKIDPAATPKQKVDALVDAAMQHIDEGWREFFVETGRAYRDDLKEFNDQLRKLAGGKRLNTKEQIERNLIQATLAVHARAAKASGMP